MAAIFANVQLKRKKGKTVDTSVLKTKMIVLYFSAHWCPPCRNFTPILKKFYEESNNCLEIIFISGDKSASAQEAYFEESHGNWLYVPLDDEINDTIWKKYGIASMPKLVLLKPDGTAASITAREDVKFMSTKAVINKWKALLS